MSTRTPNPDSQTDRDLKGEADEIKIALTKKPHFSKDDDKDQERSSKVNIAFTSLAQSSIPGLSSRKILGNRHSVHYVPDFYYILELCQRIFIEAKNNKALKRIDELNIHSFSLYMAHTLMYVFLQVVNDSNPPNDDISIALNVYHKAGYGSNEVPSVCSHWIDGLGKYLDPSSKKVFLPKLPDIVAGVPFTNGFFTLHSGHLIPNFLCMLAITRMTATRDTGMQLLGAAATQNRNGYFGLAQVGNGITNSTISRANAHRIPGCKALGVACSDLGLLQVVSVALTANLTDPVQDLLKVTPALLLQLKTSMQSLFLEIETIKLTNVNPIGTTLCTIPLISEANQAEFVPGVTIAAVVGPPNVGAMDYINEHDHASRVKSKTQITNGDVDYSYQTPIVRIVTGQESIVHNGFIFVDPQHAWYSTEIEFQTDSITLLEARSYFARTD